MPIYPYHCQECNNLWDEVIRYEEKPDECPECGAKKNLSRLLGYHKNLKYNLAHHTSGGGIIKQLQNHYSPLICQVAESIINMMKTHKKQK